VKSRRSGAFERGAEGAPLRSRRSGAFERGAEGARGRVELLPHEPGAGALRWFPTPHRGLLAASLALQLALAVLLGHFNDMRIFMATGYFVATGQNPYVPQNLTAEFHRALFATRSTIGYPPPWPLLLGLVYRATYGLSRDLLLYNAAIKLPLVAANVGLAYLAGAVLRAMGTGRAAARRAWVFLLFNPLLLYFTAAWGQIDGVVALLALAAVWLLAAGRRDAAALLLALAVCVKPVALALAPVALVYLLTRSRRGALRFTVLFAAGVALFYVLPFLVLGWDPHPATRVWHHVWDMTGTLSPMTILRLWRDSASPGGAWWLLGMAWVPALAAAAALVLWRGIGDLDDLLAKCLGLTMVFFLTRTWLSEANVVLALPFALLLVARGRLPRRALLALWLVPLLFTLAGWTPLDLLWVAFPGALVRGTAAVARFLPVVQVVRALLVVVWQVAGWWIVVACLRRDVRLSAPQAAAAPGGGLRGRSEGAAQWN
jgi:hypothetical protein